jgi:hypothetical protein
VGEGKAGVKGQGPAALAFSNRPNFLSRLWHATKLIAVVGYHRQFMDECVRGKIGVIAAKHLAAILKIVANSGRLGTQAEFETH